MNDEAWGRGLAALPLTGPDAIVGGQKGPEAVATAYLRRGDRAGFSGYLDLRIAGWADKNRHPSSVDF